ncbi:XdhC family protein [Bdellovibrio sp. SKB1291214]|uniref:XdhC family protein n=1 Tax=Bdellovibrio sp. SKB1291214 TaxID=1732569 RepID=UPI000B51E0DD|nr:XdhC family protein [Bdellovibrio sp. SKB1291214]UYL07356.1 XdhC family protein [Bdellovibrio sp. SKB1291214]
MGNSSFENDTFGFVPATREEILQVEIPAKYAATARVLAASYGWSLHVSETLEDDDIQFADVLIQMADEVSRKRHTRLQSLRESKEIGVPWVEQPLLKTKRCLLMGRTPVTESLERHLMLLNFSSRIEEDYDRLAFSSHDIVIVSGTSPRDLDLVANALFARCSHVAMVCDQEKALKVIKHLNRSSEKIGYQPLYVPAGMDIRATNPDEIALSIVVELLFRGTL